MPIWDRLTQDPMSAMILMSSLQQLPQSMSKQNLPPRGAYAPQGYGQQDGGMGDMVPQMLRMQQVQAQQANMQADNELQRKQFEYAQQTAAQKAAAEQQRMEAIRRAVPGIVAATGQPPEVVEALLLGGVDSSNPLAQAVGDRSKTWSGAPGERRFDAQGNVIADNPALLEVTPSGFADRRAGQYFRDGQMHADAMGRGRAGATNVSVSPTAIYGATQGAFDKKIYEAAGDAYVGMQKEAEASRKMAEDFRQIDSLLGETPTGQGFDQWRLKFAKAAQGIGIPVNAEAIATKEAAESLVNQFALGARSPDGPLGGLPGSTSDRDIEFLRSIPPGIEQTPAGRKLMVEAQAAKAEHRSARAQAARQYIQGRNGEVDPVELDAFKAAYDKEHPIFAGLADRWRGKLSQQSQTGNAGGAEPPPVPRGGARARADDLLRAGGY